MRDMSVSAIGAADNFEIMRRVVMYNAIRGDLGDLGKALSPDRED